MTITVEEAQQRLPELIATLKPGDALIITCNSQPVAQVVPVSNSGGNLLARQAGSAKGVLTIHAEDTEHLADFREYVE